MDSIVALPARIVEWLTAREQFQNIKFFTEFPPVMKEVPLRRAIVGVGIEEMKIVDKFVANDDGVLERQEYCRTANIDARLSICVPYSYGGTACHEIFTDIIDELIFNSDLNITESSCSEIQSDRDTSALVLNGNFIISADFCPAEILDNNYFSFLDKKFFCASHIQNSDIHVSLQEKERWNESFVQGIYFGNGNTTRSISVGFEPNAVIVFCPDYSPCEIDFANGKNKIYYGNALKGYGTRGVSLTSTGFKTNNTTNGSNKVSLNDQGLSYVYMAFK